MHVLDWLIKSLGGYTQDQVDSIMKAHSALLAQKESEVAWARKSFDDLRDIILKVGEIPKVVEPPKTQNITPLKTSRESWPRMRKHLEEADAREAYWRSKGGQPVGSMYVGESVVQANEQGSDSSMAEHFGSRGLGD